MSTKRGSSPRQAGERVQTLQVDVVLDQDERAGTDGGPQRARGVGEDEGIDAQVAEGREPAEDGARLPDPRRGERGPAAPRPARRRSGRAPSGRRGPARSGVGSPGCRRSRSRPRPRSPRRRRRGRTRARRRRAGRGRRRLGASPPPSGRARQRRGCGPRRRAGSSSPSVTVRRSPSGPQRWIGVSGRRELGQPLPAAAARRAQVRPAADHDGLDDLPVAGRHHGADGARLGALALREGGVLDVAASVNAAARGTQGGADREVGEGCVGVGAGGGGGGEEVVQTMPGLTCHGKRRRSAA